MKKEPMTAEREDKWLEWLLRHGSTDQAAAPSEACLDAGTVAAWNDGALDAREIAAAELHAADCSRCMALLTAIARTAPVQAEARSKRSLLRWLAPLAAAATAVAVWVAIPDRQQIPTVTREDAPQTQPPPVSALPSPAPLPAAPPPKAQLSPKSEVEPAQIARFNPARRGADQAQEEVRDREKTARGAQSPPASTRAAAEATASDRPTAVDQRALNNSVGVAIEGVSPEYPQIRWRFTDAGIERSFDAGQTWIRTASSPSPSIVSLRVVNGLSASATTADGRTFSTTDGGVTWTLVQEKPAAPF